MQKKYEESSNESFDFEEERYPWFILDDVNDLIFIINTKRLIVYVNKKVVDLGIPKKNLIGTDLTDLFYEKNIKNQINYFFHKKAQISCWYLITFFIITTTKKFLSNSSWKHLLLILKIFVF
ncbi:hypothetical protein PW5551_09560 [Petrotoga sp. 9PW.55.5.1]|uniref:PAS domain-containing protein n=1 Tax=Petrotoga sp. 9PW.55.5.1 TaxID=1308979 RepID=UPI000DC41D32|nr:PAS domain-containing protein [Petrotoga sp. 9PW.55.5.1]RAO98497.1 hypothetical protein PW5551_09560 [Petrotoga sp. 9PW.55.5.1]